MSLGLYIYNSLYLFYWNAYNMMYSGKSFSKFKMFQVNTILSLFTDFLTVATILGTGILGK